MNKTAKIKRRVAAFILPYLASLFVARPYNRKCSLLIDRLTGVAETDNE